MIFDIAGIVWSAIASVGWYLVGVFAIIWYYSPYIQAKYTKWKLQKDEREYAAKYHKNPDLMRERLEGLNAAREKMQAQLIANYKLEQQKAEEEKERKRQELINLAAKHGNGRVLGDRNDTVASISSNSKSKSFKPEYNPLMGENSRSYKPPKRSCCGKGGCG